MKNLISSVLFVLVSFFGFSQLNDSTNYSFDIKLKDIYKVSTKGPVFEMDSIILLKKKKLKNKIFYYNYSMTFKNLFYWHKSGKQSRRVLESGVCDIVKSTSTNNGYEFNFHNKKNKNIFIKTVKNSENNFEVIVLFEKRKNRYQIFFGLDTEVIKTIE